MRAPHVVALYYWLATLDYRSNAYQLETTDASVSFENPQPREAETDLCTFHLAEGVLTCTMKAHYDSVDKAREDIDQLLRDWEVEDALERGRREIRFVFHQAKVIDRDPPSGGQASSIHTMGGRDIASRLVLRAAPRDAYPLFPQHFKVSPDVETLWNRYEGYKQGHEPLPGMAYICQSFIEKVLARGRDDAVQKYHIEWTVLHTLGNLHSHRGDLTNRRKLEHERDRHEPPLTPLEIAWMEAAVRMLIRRIGEYAADPTASWPTLSMRDLPPL
jgi:hypothetical protein